MNFDTEVVRKTATCMYIKAEYRLQICPSINLNNEKCHIIDPKMESAHYPEGP